MGIISKFRQIHSAVWWAVDGHDTHGRKMYSAGIEISCRWDDVQSVVRKADGSEFVTKSTVYPDRRLSVDDKLWKGELTDLEDAGAIPHKDAIEVVTFETISKLRGGPEILYIAKC